MSKEQNNMMTLQDVFDAFENGFQKTPQKKVKVNSECLSSWTGSGQGVRNHCREGLFSSCQGTATSNAFSKSQESPYEIEFDIAGNPLQSSYKSHSKCNNEGIFKLRKNRDSLFEKRAGFQQSLENISIENESEGIENQSYEKEEEEYEEESEEEDDSNILAEDDEEDNKLESIVSDEESQKNAIFVDQEQIITNHQSENILKIIDPEKENKDPLGQQQFPRSANHVSLLAMSTPQQTRNASRVGISSSAFLSSNLSANASQTRINQNQQQELQYNQISPASGIFPSHVVDAFTQGEERAILQLLQDQLEGNQETTGTQQYFQNHQIGHQTPNQTFNHLPPQSTQLPSQIYHSVTRPILQRTPLRDITSTGCSPKVSRWDLSPYLPTNIRYSAQIQQQSSQEKHVKDPLQQQQQSQQSLSNRPGNPPASLYR